MNEIGRPDEYDELMVQEFQREMAKRIEAGGSADLRHVNAGDLGENEMRAFGLLEKLNDGSVTLEMFRDELSEYENMGADVKSILHYFAWLRNQAMGSLSKRQ
ncbi:hypothetical protein C4544_04170 [candidate division WS5 bacterium]|uniref:Uncharacterized protein n=1 Tax=candidate division WS5 bacterium TaxID=2093353 RepID=A0A419DCZ5_9BACT|nr:MAG: hypothetical protein C4544_04170 [candidate division WS5 bacterium]